MGKSIADVLESPVADILPLFENIPNIQAKLQTLVDVGLGYLQLGQSATTLSGGEAGGCIVAEGSSEAVAKMKKSFRTGRLLATILRLGDNPFR